jgi:methanogenic corrinoid protein MtbC1
VIEELKKQGLRGRFKVMVGGGAVSADWAKEIGADGYGKDAVEAVHVAKKILGEGQSEGIRQ